MNTVNQAIQSIEIRSASDTELAALSRFSNKIRAERLPDDPPIALQDHLKRFRSIPPFVDVLMDFVWTADQSELAAVSQSQILNMEENRHLSQFSIDVLPEYRRQGIGRLLLANAAEIAVRNNRTMMLTDTNGRVPAGEIFMEKIGAAKGLEAHTNQLRLGDLNQDLLNDWLERAKANTTDFELGLWDGPYPEERLVEIAELNDVMNQAPKGTLEIEDIHFTPEHLRQMEENLFADGSQRWVFYISERASGALAGFTEIAWNARRPDVCHQGGTGVWPQYRNRGLGRWLKAAMLKKILMEFPQINFVRTGNADSNAAMLKINNELGFKPYMTQILWQIETAKVQEYIRR